MADTTLPGVLVTGDHASRPAANAVAVGTVYACSTHNLVYQSDGSAWATWLTADGSASVVPVESWDDVVSDLAPVHRWKFDEASGNFADSGSAGALTLTASGTVTYEVTSPTGHGVQFASGAAGTAGGMGSVPVGGNARTVVIAYKSTGSITTNSSLWAYGTTSSTRQWFAFKVNDGATGTDSLAVWADDLQVTGIHSTDGTWHVAACGYAADSIGRLWIDGRYYTKNLGGALNTGSAANMKVPNASIAVSVGDLFVCSSWVGAAQLSRLYRALQAGL